MLARDLAGRRLPGDAGERDGLGHFRGAGLQHFGEAVEDLAAVVGIALRPAGTGLGGGFDGVAQILAGAVRDVGEERAGGVVQRIDAAALRADERSADVALGGFGDGESHRSYRSDRSYFRSRVIQQPLLPAFAAEAAFLVAAEGAGRGRTCCRCWPRRRRLSVRWTSSGCASPCPSRRRR